MNRNQKIALGCGGVGCLGLIVLVAFGIFGYITYVKTGSNTNTNSTRNANLSFNTNRSANSNTANDNAEDGSSSSMSEDDKHKLFQAASITMESELIQKVLTRIGYPLGTSRHEEFVEKHIPWVLQNVDFIQTVNTPEKGRAYVEAHLDD